MFAVLRSWQLIIAAIPAYNEEKTIAKVVVRAMRHVDKVVVVDDGSTDDTATIAEHRDGTSTQAHRSLPQYPQECRKHKTQHNRSSSPDLCMQRT